MSSAIVPSGGSSNSNTFAQQGTVDWTMLSGSTVNFTVEVLARLSKAGVELITVAVGQAMFTGFNLDPDGQKRFSDALSRLKAFSSYGSVMWFGFGVKHIVRTLSETEQGLTCAAICACLSLSYNKFFCSKVLKSLADQQRAPNSLMPSLSQWAALVNICSGAVLDSQFPRLVEGYSRLMQSYDSNGKYNLQEPTSADALARALCELAKVSSGTVRSVTFIGGVDCGWIAALAEWLLSLRVEILAADGSVLHSSKALIDPSYYAQVIIVNQLNQASQSNTTLYKESVFVPRGKIFFHTKRGHLNDIFFAGKSEWSTILHDTFGSDFDALLHSEAIQDFAKLLCCGFCSNSDGRLRYADPWRDTESLLSQLSFAAQRLPELVPVYQIAKQLISSPQRDFNLNEQNIFLGELSRRCSCAVCESKWMHRVLHLSKSSPFEQDNTICLEQTAFTIFEYICILSLLNIDDTIYPSILGLLMVYERQKRTGMTNSFSTTTGQNMLFETFLMPTVIGLFTGQFDDSQYADRPVSAISKGGVCVYLPSLQNPTTSPQEQLRAIVVAGHIEWESKIFSRVVDGANEESQGLPDTLASTLVQANGVDVELKLVVEETFNSDILEADLWISSKMEPSPCISYHAGHIAKPTTSYKTSSSFRRGRYFGASKIRSAILQRPSSICRSELVEICAPSSNRPVFWTGPCSEAPKSLWVDGSNNRYYSPTSEEWVLISRSQCCQEIVRGPYQLLYSVICSINGETEIRLGPATCLVCLLAMTGQREQRRQPYGEYIIQDRSFYAADTIGCVTVHSLLGSKPSSRVLLTSASFLPTLPTSPAPSESDRTVSDGDREPHVVIIPRPAVLPRTSQSPPELDYIIFDDDQESHRGVLPSRVVTRGASWVVQSPSESDYTDHEDEQESDFSASSSQAASLSASLVVQAPESDYSIPFSEQESDVIVSSSRARHRWKPRPEVNLKSAKPSERPRARSL